MLLQGRYSVVWLLLAQAVAILPRLDILPLWSFPAWLAVAYWYWRIAQGRSAFPPSWQKFALAALVIALVYWQFERLVNLEAMLAILVCALTLKLLELKSARDHWLLLLLCYFLVASGFLFSQQIGSVLIALGQLLVILIAQQSLHRQRHEPMTMLRLSLLMAAQSLPLMLALFLIFPRIGPLWSMPLPGKDARTGMSDSLEFGDVARLSRSGELAFRVSFEGEAPRQQDLYWRGLVFEDFDGRRWTEAPWRKILKAAPTNLNDSQGYTVTLEPGFHQWLYSLAVADIHRDDIRSNSAYVWSPKRPLSGRLSYRVESDISRRKPEPYPDTLRRNTSLPGAGNPKARVLANQWRQLEDPRQRVAAAQQYFLQNDFIYTLNPPTLGENNVDGFLFTARQGFCEHFAGSFAFLMRAAGVPARLVVGYQGGELNAAENYLMVHQSDAHAWVEVWLDDEGWQRIDPTSFVAPSRIQLGADALMREQGSFLQDAPLSLRHFAWATKMRYFMDSINYAWARWVLNYDEQRQWQLLGKLLGEVSPMRLLAVVMLAGGLPLLYIALSSMRLPRSKSADPFSREYLRCCRALARRGVSREPGETPAAFLLRVQSQAPEWAPWLAEVTTAYTANMYQHRENVLPSGGYNNGLQHLRKLRRPFKK
ncbi:Transglutaminase-like superfamily protein [Spongiibacter sp. IMCC21906]|uniref:transglutaminase TgpA family protein n=1 Tax=Spongiibacter sp. IMCC21906 TaxID=1620392 RepID=UPI00062DFCC0|nr:DUF3488 and transglutaminase-like domain-containing protein [Spongiibacter sp. IMCC21906]AKH69950.1 Transglutaminase-like superfamily protein [Spongiibacter sp. IMCC21906]